MIELPSSSTQAKCAPARGERFGDHRIALAAAHFLVLAEGEHDRALGLETAHGEPVHRFEDGDELAFVVERAAAPDIALGDIA